MRQSASLLLIAVLVLMSSNASALLASHQCASCHVLHGAPGYSLLNQANAANLKLTAEVVCMNCHGPTGIATKRADVHANDPNDKSPDFAVFRFSCIECHDSHDNQFNYLGRKNIKLVLPQINTPNSGVFNVSFESRGTNNAGQPAANSFADGDSVYDGICEACHTLTNHHHNDASGDHAHHAGETCTRCHGHNADYFNP